MGILPGRKLTEEYMSSTEMSIQSGNCNIHSRTNTGVHCRKLMACAKYRIATVEPPIKWITHNGDSVISIVMEPRPCPLGGASCSMSAAVEVLGPVMAWNLNQAGANR